MSASAIVLLAREVAVLANVRHACQDVREWFPLRPTQRCLQDLPVLLLGASVALGRTLLERTHELFRQVSNHELRHESILSVLNDINDITEQCGAASIAIIESDRAAMMSV
jgi:hypothetical protein